MAIKMIGTNGGGELLARVRAIMRRITSGNESAIVRIGDIEIDQS